MSFNKNQFRKLIDFVLGDYPELASESAIQLLLGTAAQESNFGTYLRQLGGGPAMGVFQMEPKTFRWLQDKYKKEYPKIVNGRIVTDLEWDLRLAILMARLRYRIVPAKLPYGYDVKGLAMYWKEHYNTPLGAGTVEQFVSNYRKFVDAKSFKPEAPGC